MTRGNDGMKIFEFIEDFEYFLTTLGDLKDRLPFHLLSYCLMSNHIHLLIQVIDIPLSRIMHILLKTYSSHFNFERGRRGHLFQDRYLPILVEKNVHYLQLLRYIPLNPVKAGIVKTPAQWAWSSHSEFIQKSDRNLADVEKALSLLDEDLQKAFGQYQSYLAAGLKNTEEIFLPDPSYPPEKKIEKPATPMQNIDEILFEIASQNGISVQTIVSGGKFRSVAKARQAVIVKAFKSGFTLREIADRLSVSISAASRSLRKFTKSIPGTNANVR